VVYKTILRTRTRKMSARLAAAILVMGLCGVKAQEVPAGSQTPLHRKSDSGAPLVIQGRISTIQGALVTVKTPDAYPGGGPGVHAQLVLAGPSFKADVSRARVLLPDGRGADTQPLAVGDRVLMVLKAPPDSGSLAPSTPANVNQTYLASIVERLVVGDKVITH
jgi:hypothetical protein